MSEQERARPQALVFPDEAFRARPPVAGPPRPFHLPAMATFDLACGVTAYLVEQHALPIVSMDLSFAGGAAADPVGKEGLASVCMAMLTEGTRELDKLAYTERLADTASSIGGYASDDSVGLTLSSLGKHLASTFALFADTLRAPGFRRSDFERLVKRRIEGVRQAKGSPASVAGRIADAVLYGPAHPYGAVVTEASLAAITLEDCEAFARTWLVPGRARLFVVGDLTEAQVRACFEARELAGWAGAPPQPPALAEPRTMAGRIFFVDLPGATQSTVSYLQHGPPRTAPDYFATAMLGAVLGGGFTSRLNMNLREAKGYSYGARGQFSYTRAYGALTASAPVAGDATVLSILEIDREIKRLAGGTADHAVTGDELEREKLGAVLGLPGRFATAQAALGQYRGLVYYGLPLDYFASYVERVRAVSVGDVTASAVRHLRPADAVYVVVGSGDTPQRLANSPSLRDALGELAARGDVGAGGLVELDSDGRPISH
ncbi:MAG TPA: pitrilysin family protein [Kofleriaceae bacterium]|nr:pitrilysin family protein [Kofleriaceae bacterium]